MCVVRGAAVGPERGRSNRPFAKRMQVIRVPISMPTDGNSSGRFYDPEIRAEISRRPKERITVEGTYYRSGTTPSPFVCPKAQSVTQVTYDAAFSSYIPDHKMHPPAKESVMTWSSDRTSVLLYAILATLLVMAWIYVPA
jgi:hypothetical protein